MVWTLSVAVRKDGELACVFRRKVQIRGEGAKRKLNRDLRRSFSICTLHMVLLHLLSTDGWNRRHVGVKKRKQYTGRKYNVKRMQSSVSNLKVTRREILTCCSSSWRRVFWYQHFGETCCLNIQNIWDDYSVWFSETICEDKDSYNLKMEAAGSSETLLPIYLSTLRHIPEDGNLNLKYLEEKMCCYGQGQMAVK